jgi:hypothetical protein
MSSVEQEEPMWSEQRVQEAVYLHSSRLVRSERVGTSSLSRARLTLR